MNTSPLMDYIISLTTTFFIKFDSFRDIYRKVSQQHPYRIHLTTTTSTPATLQQEFIRVRTPGSGNGICSFPGY